MKKGLIFIIVLMFTVSWAFAEKGAPIQYDPANYPAPERQGGNTVATATVISVLPYNDFGTTSGYSNNYDEVCPYTGSTSPDVVYSFSPTSDVTNGFVSLCGNTYYDSKLYIYENTVTPGTPFACNDDECTSAVGQSYVSELTGLTFAAGNTYYIVIDGYGGDSGNYELDFTGDIANDNCATATAIGEVTDLPFNTSLATASGFYIGSKDLWYVFTAPSDGTIYVGTCGSSYDTAIALFGECDVATLIAYNDDSCGLQSELTNISVVSGEDYYIQVGGYSSYSGYGYLDLAFTPAPPVIAVNPTSMDEYLNIGEISTQVLNIANNGTAESLSFNISHDFITDTESSAPRNYGDYADRSRINSSDNSFLEQHTSMSNNFPENRAAGDVLGVYTGMPAAYTGNMGMVWVGDLLYSANYDINQLTVYDISTQSVIASYPIHSSPFGITWDGMYLWIGDGYGNVYAYNLDGSSAGYSFSCPFSMYPALSWDGNYFVTSPIFTIDPTIYKLDATGAVIDSYTGSIGMEIWQIVWVPEHTGGNLWMTNTTYNTIIQLNLIDTDGTYNIISSFTPPPGEMDCYAITHNNNNLWWADWDGPLYEIDDGIMEGWLSYDISSGLLGPGENIDVTVTFDATEIYGGTYLAEMVVSCNDPVTPQVIVPIMLDVTGEPDIETSVTSIDFGTIPYGQSTPEFFTVSNIGTDWLDISDIVCDNSDFIAVIPSAEDITIELEVDYYYYEATWNIWDYATSSYYYASNQTFSTSYQIVTTTLSMEPGLFSIHCWDSYGDGGIGGTVTDAQANVLASWYSYDYSSYAEYDFIVDGVSDIALSLYVMEQQELAVIFTPTASGTITGDLTIYSNDPDEPELVVTLNGVCTVAEIVVDPTSMSEALFVGETETQILNIENTGDEELNFDISIVSLSDAVQVFDVTTFNDNFENRPNNISTNGVAKSPEFSKKIYENQMQSRELTNILVFEATPDNMHYDTALNNLGLSRTLVTDWYVFDSELIGGTVWDLVIVNSYSSPPSTTQLDNLNSYLVGGGNLIYFDWAMFNYPGHALLLNMDISYVSSFGTPINFSAVDPGHSIFNDPNVISNLFWTHNQWGTDGQIVDVLGAANQLAAFDGYASSGACVLNASGTSFFNAFQADNFNGDDDSDGKLDIVELIENQISYFMEVGWLEVDISTGSLLPGESIDITVTFDATELYGGIYEAELVIENNDPANQGLTVPVTLEVTGVPDITVDPVSIDYGAHFVGATIEEILTISSTGTDDLEITEITSDNPDFYVDVTTYTISPEHSEEIIVYFNPSTVGVITGVLTVYSNDPNEPEVYIDLVGEGLDAPEIVVTPASFDENIAPDVTVDNTLTIENTGLVDLNYAISIEYMIPTDRVRNYGDYADRSREVSSDINLPSRQSTSMRQGFSDNRSAGDILGTYTGMPTSNTGMVWVGDLLYISEYSAGQIAVYDISTQSVIATYPIHTMPFGITWDGNYLWVGDGVGNIHAYNLDGSSAGFSFSSPVGGMPALTWDGEYFLACYFSTINPTIYKLDETGAVIDSYTGSIGMHINSFVWVPEHTDGNLWITDCYSTSLIAQLDLTDTDGTYAIVSSFTHPGGESYAIGHRNFNLWWSTWSGPLYEIDDGIAEFSWLSIDISSGTLGTGISDDITVTVDANEVDSLGVYEASLVIISNDPDDPVVYVPVTLTVNYPPEIVLPDNFTFDEDDGLMVDFDTYITDPNSSPYELSVTGNTNVTVEIVGSEVTFGAAPDWYGTETLTFTVDDGQTDSDVVDIIVTPVNDDPTIVLPDDFTFDEDEELIVDFSEFVDDIDLDVLTLSVTGNTEITVDIVDLEVTFGAAENWNGTETLTFTVDDGQGERVSFTTGRRTQQKKESNIENSRATADDVVDVIVLPVNDDPTIVLPDDFTFDEDDELIVDFSEFVDDIDLDVLTLTVTGNTEITVDIVDLEVTFGAAENWNGTETLTFTVDDGQGERVSFTTGRRTQQKKESNIENSRATADDVVDVIVLPVNDDPTIVLPDDFTFEEDDGLVVDFTEFIDDVDPDDLTLTVTGNTEITVEIVGFEVTFGATENWNGTETLTFIIDDNVTRATAEDDVDVIVTPVNDEPVLIGFLPEELAFTVVEDSTVTFSVDVEDIDSTVEYEWYVDDVLQTEVTEEFVYTFEVVGDIAIKSVAFDEEYDIETIWIVEVEAGSGIGDELIPVITRLNQNYPNPFNPTTTISFDVKENETGNLRIYNMKGQLVFTKSFGTGQHKFLWDAASCSSGIYFYNLKTFSYSHTRKMILLK